MEERGSVWSLDLFIGDKARSLSFPTLELALVFLVTFESGTGTGKVTGGAKEKKGSPIFKRFPKLLFPSLKGWRIGSLLMNVGTRKRCLGIVSR